MDLPNRESADSRSQGSRSMAGLTRGMGAERLGRPAPPTNARACARGISGYPREPAEQPAGEPQTSHQ